jgi:predicted transcriptional regulator
MELLWAKPDDFHTVRDIAGALDDDLAYTTVMTVLSRLHRKEFVERRQQGRAWAYRPRLSQADHVAHTMTAAFNGAGDRHGALLKFVDQLTPGEQQALRDQLDRGSR